MYAIPLSMEKHINKRGYPIITSGDKNAPNSIFSQDIFGVLETERYKNVGALALNCRIMWGWCLDEFKRIDRTIFECATTRNKFLFKNGSLTKVANDYQKETLSEKVGYGPEFLYNIWADLDKTKYIKEKGKLANVLMSDAVTKYRRDDIFTSFYFVPSIGFREESNDSRILINEMNIVMAEMCKFSSLIKDNAQYMETSDLKVYLQNKVLEAYELGAKLFGSKGQIRKNILSRVVDGGAIGVILPATFSHPKLGYSRFKMNTMGYPIFHLNKMYNMVTKRFFTLLVEMLFDNNLFESGVTSENLIVYDMEFIDNAINSFEDPFFKLSYFPAIKADGTYGTINMDFTLEDGTVENKPLTWIEFFYILHACLSNIEKNKYTVTTRYPVDSDKSSQFVKPVILTLTDEYLRTVSFLSFSNVEYFPYITPELRERYDEKIYESSFRLSSVVAVACNADHDGDKMSSKPIQADESVAELDEYHDQLMAIFNYTGDFSRKVGKCAAQTMFTFTREPKPRDKSKVIDNKHPFIKYLMEVEKGELELETLYKYTTVYGDKKAPEISLYDTVNIKRLGKTVTTTIGQLIVNRVIFWPFWDNEHVPYVHYMTEKAYTKRMKLLKQLSIEGKVAVSDMVICVDAYCEFVLRLATIYNAGCSIDMLNPDEEFKAYRDKCFAEVKDQIIKNNDIDLFNKTVSKIIDFAKVHFKGSDMYELYESEGKSSWTGDFATMQIAVGPMPSLSGGPPTIIFESLSDGIPLKYTAALTNTGMRGAVDRGNETALAGEQYKNINNATQSIMGYRGDCGSTKGETVNIGSPDLLYNRYVIEKNGSLTKIDTSNVDKYLNKDIVLRSPMYCRTKNGHFCSTCVGTEPFDMKKLDTVNIGLYISDIASKILNLFMGSTHELVVKIFHIKDFNDYIYPKAKADIFYTEMDPIDGVLKIKTNQDIEWRVPKSAVAPVDTTYRVLAHGSVVATESGSEHAIILGTEVYTSPAEISKPDSSNNSDAKHYVFRYKKGDTVLNSTTAYMLTHTVYRMIQLYLRGAVSNLIPLESHKMTLRNTFKANKSLGDNDLSITILLATLARDAKDVFKPVRETGNSEYMFIATDDMTAISSTFNGMIGPDAGRSMFFGMTRSYEEQTKNPSPVERAFQS